ncbi:lipoyl synthase [Capillibacterium thermochitinicola]|uniref:Lipoyl synthase n=1 Tax=Capillibacterium thermochitinicola TaxID=2699427 RepID=A0A8J6HZR2_9FIRM|nr:lipoyl synthase [Capillibacterium thermochitinicola]MBA2133060.1 lipoyl synthase [Capillibacterium thermochitinicola]
MEQRKPEWLKIKVQANEEKADVEHLLDELALPTVCKEARCPNLMECYSRRTATFLILGRNCTRHCRFCNVQKGQPEPVASDEPARVAQAVARLQLNHVVVTSVTRDDLPDGGAGQFAAVVTAIRRLNPGVTVEVLIPDFRGDPLALQKVLAVKPDVLNHNIETVPRLYPAVRPEADYRRSLTLLARVKEFAPRILTKSGVMVGLGETEDELTAVMKDLRAAGCDALTIGQYLAPSRAHHRVVAYITPAQFARYERIGRELGFRHVAAGPFVRSSYRAAEAFTAYEV